jgi:hypothetical protein
MRRSEVLHLPAFIVAGRAVEVAKRALASHNATESRRSRPELVAKVQRCALQHSTGDIAAAYVGWLSVPVVGGNHLGLWRAVWKCRNLSVWESDLDHLAGTSLFNLGS